MNKSASFRAGIPLIKERVQVWSDSRGDPASAEAEIPSIRNRYKSKGIYIPLQEITKLQIMDVIVNQRSSLENPDITSK